MFLFYCVKETSVTAKPKVAARKSTRRTIHVIPNLVEANAETEAKNERPSKRKSTKPISEEVEPTTKARASRQSLAAGVEASTKRNTRKPKQIDEEAEPEKKTETRTKRVKAKSPVNASKSLKKDANEKGEEETNRKEDEAGVVIEGDNENLKRRKRRATTKPAEKTTNESLNNADDSFSKDLKEAKEETNKQGNMAPKLFFHSKRRSETAKDESKTGAADLGLNSTPSKKFKLFKSKSSSSENLNASSDDEVKMASEQTKIETTNEIIKSPVINGIHKENEEKSGDDEERTKLNEDQGEAHVEAQGEDQEETHPEVHSEAQGEHQEEEEEEEEKELINGKKHEEIADELKKPRGRSKSMIVTSAPRNSFRKNAPKVLSTGIALTDKQKQVN